MTEGVKCLLLLFLTHHVALFLRLDAARNRFVCDDDDGLLVIHDLDKRFADLHGQFLAVLVEEHHAVFEVLGCTAIARPAAADVFAVLEDFGRALTVQPDSCINMLKIMYLVIPFALDAVITFILSRMKVEEANEKLRAAV